MSKMSWTGKKAYFDMTVKGGGLPDNFEVTIPTVLDCDADFEVVKDFIAGGQSGRVAMQVKLRSLGTDALKQLQSTGLRIHIRDIKDVDAYLSPEIRQAKVIKAAKSAIEGLSPEQKAELLALLQS